MTDHGVYFEYLKRRSFAGLLYRRYLLYPRICHYLTGRVLDIGCGLGDMLKFRPGTIGVDINPKTVEWCRARDLPAYLMKPDKLPFDNATFDGAILDNVLEHLSEPEFLLAEIQRVLAPNGRLVVGVPGRRGFDSDSDHKIFYDEEALATRIGRSGFRCVKLLHMPFSSTWLERRLRQYCIYAIFSCNKSKVAGL